MTIEFLGHKQALLDFVCSRIRAVAQPGRSGAPVAVADLFCGTGSVSRELKRLGYRVLANDTLAVATVMTEAILANHRAPPFRGIADRLPKAAPRRRTRYDQVLDLLNALPPRRGFLWQSYSPASETRAGVARQYFTRRNAGRLDAIRMRIADWEPALTSAEHALLLSDLLGAANAVSNIAGTYGCYLKHWKDRARLDLQLERSRFVGRPSLPGTSRAGAVASNGHRVFRRPANELAPELRAPIVYADPPYTKRQYAAYYHVLETIVRYDAPRLTGSTGLRPWQDQASDYCYRKRAPAALADLLSGLRCEHFFLSYNEDGQIPHGQLLDLLAAHGRVKVHETRYRRYRSSAGKHKGTEVTERLYHVAMGTP